MAHFFGDIQLASYQIAVMHFLRSHYEGHTILGELLQYIAHT